jgi:hypothetical protein
MFTNKNIRSVMIGGNQAYTSATNITGMAAGQVALVDAFGVVITTSTDALNQKFRIVQGRGTGLSPRVTDLIDPSGGIRYYKGARHYNETEQVTDVGFNGTTGVITATNSNSYFLRLNLIETNRIGFAQQDIIHGTYVSDSSATQWEVSKNVSVNVNDNVRKRYERDVQATCILDIASATEGISLTTAGSNEVDVVKNSDIFNEGTIAWAEIPLVGEVIVLDNVAQIGYEVVEVISSTSVRVHMPYQGASASDQDAIAYTAASVAGVACGIRLSGIKRKFDATKPGLFRKVRWNTQLDKFGNSTLTSVTAPSEGKGNFEEVAKMEYFGESVNGNKYRKDHMFRATIDTDLTGTTYYGSLNIAWQESHFVSGIGAQPISNKECVIYLGDGAADSSWAASGQVSTLLTLLNTITGTTASFA